MSTIDIIHKDIFDVIFGYLYASVKNKFVRSVSLKYRHMFFNTFMLIKTNSIFAHQIKEYFPKVYLSFKPSVDMKKRGMNLDKFVMEKLGQFNEVYIVDNFYRPVDLSPLRYVSVIHLKGVNIRDVSPLSNAYYLDISHTSVDDISSLSNVQILIAKGTNITSVNGLNSIKFLDIENTLVSDVSSLITLDTIITSHSILERNIYIDEVLINLYDSLMKLGLIMWRCNMFNIAQRVFMENRYRVYQEYVVNDMVIFSDVLPSTASQIT